MRAFCVDFRAVLAVGDGHDAAEDQEGDAIELSNGR